MKSLLAAAGMAGVMLVSGIAAAQPPIYGDLDMHGARIDDREANLEAAITKGANNGWLSPDQIRSSREDLRSIREDEMAWRTRDGGHLGPDARHRLGERLDRLERVLHEVIVRQR